VHLIRRRSNPEVATTSGGEFFDLAWTIA